MSQSNEIKTINVYPLAIRWFHWINFPLIMMMIWSGTLIYWANQAYLPIPYFLTEPLGLSYNLAEGLGWHFLLMWLFALNGLLYVIYIIWSGEWKFLIPDKLAFKEALQVFLHDLKLSKIKPMTRGKFNGAQRVIYTLVILMGFGSLVTGIAIYKPVQAGKLTWLLGGYEAARFEHFCLTLGFVAFFIVHIVQVIRAGWNNCRSMITGFKAIDDN